MNTMGLVLLGVGGLLLFLLLQTVIGLSDRRRVLWPWRSGLIAGVLCLVYLLCSLWMDRLPVQPGMLLGKHEHMSPLAAVGGVVRFYGLDVAYTDATGDRQATIWVGEARYDALAEGTAVTVRAWHPTAEFGLVRLAEQTTRTATPWRWGAWGLGLLCLGALLLRWIAAQHQVESWRALGTLAILAAVALLLAFSWLLFAPGQAHDQTAQGTVTAADLHLYIDNDVQRGELAQPFVVVTFAFTPHGWAEPISALDSVDLPPQAIVIAGDSVEVGYRAAAPRRAQLLHAARTHRWRNPAASLTRGVRGLLRIWEVWVALAISLWVGYRYLAKLWRGAA